MFKSKERSKVKEKLLLFCLLIKLLVLKVFSVLLETRFDGDLLLSHSYAMQCL